MGLLSDFTAYVDSLKRRGANTAREFAADPMGLLGRNVSAFSESLPAAPGEPPNEMLARPGMQDWATGVAMNAPTMGLLGHTVYHGSPHKFDKFDASKIGTGEGAQAYGYGLYFAESPGVAQSYAGPGRAIKGPAFETRLSNRMSKAQDEGRYGEAMALEDLLINRSPTKASQRLTVENGYSPDRVAEAQATIKKYAHEFEESALYKADLPDEWLPKMLDWDKPLSQQPEAVKQTALFQNLFAEEAAYKARYPGGGLGERLGSNVVSNLGKDKVDAAKILREQGIPGIRYLDQGSRGAGEGSYNYVVFPGMEHLLKILERE